MNYFGVNLTGKKVVYKAKQFYKANASVEERTFLCESGPGCLATKEDSVGQYTKPYGYTTIVAKNLADGAREMVDSYALEAYFNRAGNLVQREDDFTEEPAMIDVTPTLLTPNSVTPESKPRGRKAWKPMGPEVTAPAAVVAAVVEGVVVAAKLADIGHRHDAPVQAAPVNGTLVTAAEGGLDLAEKVDTTGADAAAQIASDAVAYAVEAFSPERAVALYQGGMKVSDIAARFGDRNKQNRVRKACKDAGVYQGK